MFEPYSAGFTDASPLINKVKSSGASALFSLSYLNDLILIVRTVKQVGSTSRSTAAPAAS